jgi:hypothetical protein
VLRFIFWGKNLKFWKTCRSIIVFIHISRKNELGLSGVHMNCKLEGRGGAGDRGGGTGGGLGGGEEGGGGERARGGWVWVA